MLSFRGKPVIVRATVMSPLNEPLAKLVYPRPPWWQVCLSVLARFLEVDWQAIAGWLQTLQFRRRVREA